MAHQAGAYLSFCTSKRQGAFLTPPAWDAIPSQGYPSIKFTDASTLSENITQCSPARGWTRTAPSGVECTIHEATAPPHGRKGVIFFKGYSGPEKCKRNNRLNKSTDNELNSLKWTYDTPDRRKLRISWGWKIPASERARETCYPSISLLYRS